MTEEKIDKLIELLSQRRDLQREIDALTLVFQTNSELLRYKITDNKSKQKLKYYRYIIAIASTQTAINNEMSNKRINIIVWDYSRFYLANQQQCQDYFSQFY